MPGNMDLSVMQKTVNQKKKYMNVFFCTDFTTHIYCVSTFSSFYMNTMEPIILLTITTLRRTSSQSHFYCSE